MSLYIKDNETAELADRLKTTKQDAVKSAVKAELNRLTNGLPFDERLKAFYEQFPIPAPTGLKADKAFFDEISGEFD